MKSWRNILKRISRAICGIPTVERVLLVLMALLFVQFFIMLTGDPDKDVSSIDVVARSMAAMIFGYFIGGNMGSDQGEDSPADAIAQVSARPTPAADVTSARIGFSSEATEPSSSTPRIAAPAKTGRISPGGGGKYQVRVVGVIGFLALTLMFLMRNVEAFHATLEMESSIATLSQLRDFAAGSIGFLVSSTKKR